MNVLRLVRIAWLRFRIRRFVASSASDFAKSGDVAMLKAMVGTRWEHRAVDTAARLIHETLEDPRFNGPWRSHHRSVAVPVIRELFEATFPPGFVIDVFDLVEMMESAR